MQCLNPRAWLLSSGVVPFDPDLCSRLIKDMSERQEPAMRELILHTVVVNNSALYFTAYTGDLPTVQLLVGEGFIDVDDHTLLSDAACTNDETCVEIAQVMIDFGAQEITEAIHMAIRNRKVAIVELLRDHQVATCGINAVHDDRMAVMI